MQRPAERMTVGTFSVRIVSVAALRVETQRPSECLEERGLARTVLANEEGYRSCEVELEVLALEQRDRERMNAALDSVLP
jgi:hypothetical protein